MFIVNTQLINLIPSRMAYRFYARGVIAARNRHEQWWCLPCWLMINTMPCFQKQNAIKISEQSALAVIQYLRDNQHQFKGRSGFALA